MPIDYQLSKVYTIRSPSTIKFYIGTTVKTLSGRFSQHKSNYKSFIQGKGNDVSSFEILKLGDAYIELLESYPCNSNEELHKREGELIRLHKDNVVNKNIAGRTNKEYSVDNKDYYKSYRENNKDKSKAYREAYREANKEQIKANREYNKDKSKAYREANKEQIKAKREAKKANKDNKDKKIKLYQQQIKKYTDLLNKLK